MVIYKRGPTSASRHPGFEVFAPKTRSDGHENASYVHGKSIVITNGSVTIEIIRVLVQGFFECKNRKPIKLKVDGSWIRSTNLLRKRGASIEAYESDGTLIGSFQELEDTLT